MSGDTRLSSLKRIKVKQQAGFDNQPRGYSSVRQSNPSDFHLQYRNVRLMPWLRRLCDGIRAQCENDPWTSRRFKSC